MSSVPLGETSARAGLRGPLLMVDDGMRGGVRRVSEYLMAEWAQSPGAPEVDRIALRGEGSLRASVPTYVLGLARFALRLAYRRPAAVHVNLTQRGSTWRALPVLAMARLGRLPVLLALHSSEYRAFTGALSPRALEVVRWAFRSADAVAVLGAGWAAYAREALRVPEERLWVVPNAVPGPERVHPRAPGPPRLLFLGQVGRRKGTGELLAALARPEVAGLPWRLIVAGDGDVEAYTRQARELGIADRVEFTGWIGPDGVDARLHEADVFVLPSHAEGLPLAVLEAMAYGLAIVTTPVGAIPEVIDDGVTGVLVPPGDSAALGTALARLLADEDARSALAAGARSRWERDHDLRHGARRMLDLYARIAR
ncbi:MAG: glycosyltransferase family 4 protein [Dehalococcoidia bacterium]